MSWWIHAYEKSCMLLWNDLTYSLIEMVSLNDLYNLYSLKCTMCQNKVEKVGTIFFCSIHVTFWRLFIDNLDNNFFEKHRDMEEQILRKSRDSLIMDPLSKNGRFRTELWYTQVRVMVPYEGMKVPRVCVKVLDFILLVEFKHILVGNS